MTPRRRRILLGIAGALLVAAFISAALVEGKRRDAWDAAVWFFDVGQGDAALIRDREGRTLLIDGGPDDAVLDGLAEALPWWDRSLDAVLVTHLDADHYVGLFAVLRKYRVGEVLWNGAAPSTATARRFVETLARRGVPTRVVRAGDRVVFAGGSAFSVLHPSEDVAGRVLKATNDAAVVGRFGCGEDGALFASDISSDVERALVASGAEIGAEVLKVAHHGSRFSSDEAFLDAVAPREAIVSSGVGNRYGHPAPRVLAALLDRGVRIHRTDRDGHALFACAGGRLIEEAIRGWRRP